MSYLYNSTGYPVYAGNIVNGSGCYVYDETGSKYLDFESGVWCLPLGHRPDRLVNVIEDQLFQISHVGYKYNHRVAEQAAEKLVDIAGFSEGKCVFLSSGSEAVEYGIQIAKSLRPGLQCICLENQYLAAYGSGATLPDTEGCCIPWDNKTELSTEEWYEKLSQMIKFQEVGVFVFEAGNSSGLVNLPPSNLVKALNQLVKKYNILTVVDEVTCGMGRTGKWFGYMNYDLSPDIIALGKGLGNGYPVSAVILTEEVAADGLKAGFHYAQSHQNDPLGCRIALEVIDMIEEGQLLKQAETLGIYMREGYEKLQQSFPVIEEVRGIGLLNAVGFSDSMKPEQLEILDRQLFDAGYIVGMKPVQRTLRTYVPLIADTSMIDSYFLTLKTLLLGL